MRQIIVGQDRAVSNFMQHILQNPTGFTAGRGIGVADMDPAGNPFLLAGIWFEAYNGANMMMHVAALPQTRWMTKEVLWYTFHYPFIEMNVRRVTGLLSSNNHEAIEFDTRLGFHLEATLKDAAPDGDLLVYVMFREECRWLGLRDRVAKLRNKVN